MYSIGNGFPTTLDPSSQIVCFDGFLSDHHQWGLSKHWKPARGIRQGDPLSPYLFLLCHNILSIMLMEAQKDKHNTSIKVNHGSVSRLLFVDDS